MTHEIGEVSLLYVTADEERAQEAVRHLPEHAAAEVVTARTVADAVELLDDGFDCVVSDADLPDVSGVVLLEALRVRRPDMPFLLLTDEEDDESVSRAVSARVTDCLSVDSADRWKRLGRLVESAVSLGRTSTVGTSAEAVLDAMLDPVVVLREGNVVHANSVAVDSLGFESADSATGAQFAACFEETDGVDELVSSVEAGDGYAERAEERVTVGGSSFPVELNAVRVVWNGEPSTVVVLRRISRRISVEERLHELARVNDVFRRVNRAVINASTVEELERNVCETLADSEPYLLAWIGGADEDGNVVSRASGGYEDDYLDEVEITVDEESTGQGPTGRAFRTRETQVMQNIPEDPKYEPWRDAALERGYRSSAAVPLIHDGELYGVLNLYADRSHAFDADEKELVEELADDIAFAERALRERDELENTKRRYDAVFEDPNTLTGLLDPDGRLIDVNQKAMEYIHVDSDEFIGEPFWETPWWTGVEDEVKGKILRAAEGDYVDFEMELERTGGETEKYVSSGVIYPVEDGTGEVESLFVLAHDVTERRERERELRRYEAYVNSTTDIITHLGEDGTILYHSPSIEDVLGVDQEAWIGDNVFDYVHPDDMDTALERFNSLVEGGDDELDGIELRMRRADGSPVWVEVVGRHEPTDELDGVLLTSRDITDRKEREQELRRSRDEYEELIDGMNDMVFVIGLDENRFLSVNDAVVEKLGYPRDQLLSMTPYDIDTGLEDDKVSSLIENMPEDGIQNFETAHETADGERIPVEISSSLITYRDETAVLSIGRDITDRKERERELHRRVRAIEEAPVGISISEPGSGDNPLVYVNKYFEKVTGYAEDEVLGRDCRFLQGEETDPEPVRRMREAIDAEDTVEVELLNYRKDGSEFWNRVAISPVFDDSGEVINYVGYQQDVTERKEREQHMRVIDRVLRHNLRNDLNVVRGYAQTLAETNGEAVERYTDGIVERCDDLLEKAGKERRIIEILTQSPTYEEVDVSAVARRVVDSALHDHPDTDIRAEVGETQTLRVSSRFERALAELVENAVVHNDAETPEVVVSAEVVDDRTEVRVADNGPRIPQMEVDVLTAEAEGPLYHGSGLGLWFVHWVVRRSGGTLSFEENEPRGNVVTVSLGNSHNGGKTW